MKAVLALFLFAGFAASANLTNGFTETRIASGLNGPTAMQFAPDGRIFITEQGGWVRVVKNGALLPTLFLTVNVEWLGERGLLGIAFDPNFAVNQYVYVYYTVPGMNRHNRVSRFTANGDVAIPGSETILLDLDPLSAATNHNGGAMHFGPDGKLYVAVGENNIGANAQSFSNLLGKILRINTDGSAPFDNPFVSQTTGKNQSIWAYGLRNPYTFAFQPGTGRIFINDVGQNTWEEINDGVAGANYGWPTTEGPTTDPRFRSPIFAYQHASGAITGCAITGGTFYNPQTQQFPSSYNGTYFFGDYCGGWIRNLDPTTGATSLLATNVGEPVDLKVGPDGLLYYLAHNPGELYKVQSTASQTPRITQQPANVTVAVGQTATFTVAATGATPLTYQWQRGGVDIPGATSASLSFQAASSDDGATFRVVVSNQYGNATSNTAVLTVTSNRAPTAVISSPAVGTLYAGGDMIVYAGSATDPEDGTLQLSAFTWRVDFHHDTHTHPFVPPTSGSRGGSFVIPRSGETSPNVFYRIYLTVKDSGGLTSTVTRDVIPRKVNITVQTNPAGLQVLIDGQPAASPVTFQGVVGIIRTIGAPTPQTQNGIVYAFAAWSDAGAESHNITTPASNTTYTATYQNLGGGGGGAVNLLTDAGFELNGQNWQHITSAGRSTSTAQPRTGARSLQMAASNVYRREVFQDIASAPGSSYAASGWIQTSGLAGAAEIRVLWLNAAGQTIRTDVVGSVTGTSPWTFASVTLNAPPNTHTARFWTQIPPEPDGAGFAWFDDLTFNGVPVANPPLTDPGFENNGQGWQRTTNGGRSIVNTQSHSGSFSQEMTAHPQWTREVDQDIRVQAGSPNTVSGWIKTANLAAGASIRVLWLDGAGSTIHPDTTAIVSGTQPWTYVTGTFTAPAGTVSARVRLFLAVEPDGAGSAWFDDIGFQ